MTFLELVNALSRESSAAGDGVSTVVSQTGEAGRLVSWIQQAYEDIQNEYFDWRFLKKADTFTTQLVTNVITPPDDLHIWDIERIYDAAGQQMEVIEYADLTFQIDPTEKGTPTTFIIKNDNTLIAYPAPDSPQTYTYDYYRLAFELLVDTDEPAFPVQFQRTILGRALMYYGNYESAEEVKQQGAEMYQLGLKKLIASQTMRKQQFYGRSDAVDIVIEPQ